MASAKQSCGCCFNVLHFYPHIEFVGSWKKVLEFKMIIFGKVLENVSFK